MRATAQVTHPEHSAKTPRTATGFFATLRAFLRLPGSGAPSSARALGALAAATLAIGLFPTAAQAAQQYPFLGRIGPLEFGSSSLAVAPSSGDLFRSTEGPEENFHPGPSVIDVRDSSGAPLATWTGASTPAGSFATEGHDPVLAFDESTSLSDPHAGDLYVLDRDHRVVDVFSSPASGEHYLCQITGAGEASTSSSECDTGAPGVPGGSLPGNASLTAISVDPATGDLYVASERNPTAVFEFSPAGAYLSQIIPPVSFEGLFGLAVDDHSGDLLVGSQEESHKKPVVGLFTLSSGEYLETWTGSPATNPPGTPDGKIGNSGLAVDNSTGDVYVSSGSEGVYRFDSADPYLSRIAGVPASRSFHELNQGTGALVIDQATHRVYVAVSGFREHLIDVFGDQTVLVPDVVPAPANPLHAYAATLNATVNPDEVPLTSCRFEYVTEAAFNASYFEAAKTVPCEQTLAQIGAGNSPVPVSAEIGCQNPVVEVREGKCLKPETAYYFRLNAANANESPNPISYGAYSAPQPLETLPIPLVLSGQATEVDPTTATLEVEANPKGHPTTCQVEYGTSTAYGETVPCEPANLGEGFANVTATAQLEGLTEGATYHWRAVVSNVAATVSGPDHTFVYLHSQAEEVSQSCPNQALREENASRPLPACRAYELVSPAQKNGAAIGRGFLIGPDLAAPSGETVFGFSIQAFAGAGSSNGARSLINGDPFSFDRTAAGWATTALAPPATLIPANTPYGLNPETRAALFAGSPLPQGPDHFLVHQPDGEFLDLGPITPPAAGPTTEKVELLGTSADLSHVLYTMESRWPFDATKASPDRTLYEYAGPSSQPLLVGVNGGPESTALISVCRTDPGGFRVGGTANGALSADGSTVYFTASQCAHGSGQNEHTKVPANTLYARIDGEGPEARTVLISGRSPTQCTGACATSPPSSAAFWGASADGSHAFFASTQQLTDQASQDPSLTDSADPTVKGCDRSVGHGGCNLYLYEDPQQQPLSGTHLIDVSAGDTSGQGPGVQGLIALSPDASHAYFVASGVLASNPGAATDPQTGEPQQAQAGADNLYLYQRDAQFPAGHTTFVATLSGTESEEWNTESDRTANLTSDGRFLLFSSHASLTPDDTRPQGPAQLYLYDAQSEQLLRVSVGERGFNDDGNASIADAQPAKPNAFSPSPSISTDGSRVFFESPAGLTPGALDDVQIGTTGPLVGNLPTYAENIYEWHQGEVRLISDGRDTASVGEPHNSVVHLIGASADGKNVFFTTDDPLVPADSDTQLDIYDARIEGGFPKPPAAEECETSEVCHPGGTAPGPAQTHASAAFNGPEEGPGHPQKPPVCKKGFVLKHGHCVKQHRRKHHKRSHRRAANNNRGGAR